MNQHKVSIIIVNWNGLEDTIECLHSLGRVNYANYEVIVVDNGSEGRDAKVFKERFGNNIKLIENDRNYGFAEGNNIGISYALQNSNPDYILLLNNDTVVDADFLSELVKTAESGEKIGAVQSKILRKDNPNIIDSAGQEIFSDGSARDISINNSDDGRFDSVREIFGPCAAAALYKSEALRNVGLLDKRFFILLEDVDLSWRLRLCGYSTLFVPSSLVYHKRGISGGQTPTGSHINIILYYGSKNGLCLLIKYYPLNLILKFLPFHCLLLLRAMYYGHRMEHPSNIWEDLLVAFRERKKNAQYGSLIPKVQNAWITKKRLGEVYGYYFRRAWSKLLSPEWWRHLPKSY